MKNQNQDLQHAFGRPLGTVLSTVLSTLTARLGACSLSVMGSLMVMMMAVSSSVARAQDELRPPKTDAELSSPKYIILFVAVLLVAGVVFAASMRSKRTHQD